MKEDKKNLNPKNLIQGGGTVHCGQLELIGVQVTQLKQQKGSDTIHLCD